MMAKARTLPALLAIIVIAEEGLRLALRHFIKRHKKAIDHQDMQEPGRYGGLESKKSRLVQCVSHCSNFLVTCLIREIVTPYLTSFSSSPTSVPTFWPPALAVVSANRALETEEPEPYILDALAAGLCGQEALDARRARDRVAAPADPPVAKASALLNPEPMAGSCQRPIPRLIMRTKFFDDVVTAVTWCGSGVGEKAGDPNCHKMLLAAVRRAERPCRQVVLLGSGLDARPWRLPLPPGVRWFEVDRADVLAAKQARLQALGAQIDAGVVVPPPPVSDYSGAGSAQFILPKKQQQQQQQQQQVQATQAGGDGAVRSASGAPVKWRYPLHAAKWSCCAVDLQRRGWSRGLLDQGLDSSLPVLWVLEGLLYYLDEPDVCALLQEAASISAPGSIIAASVIRAVQSADSIGGATLLPPQGGSSRLSGGKGPSGEGQATYRLNNEFKWKCRKDIPKFFGDCGWGTMACLSWLDAAKSYGLPTAEATASSVFFLTAALG